MSVFIMFYYLKIQCIKSINNFKPIQVNALSVILAVVLNHCSVFDTIYFTNFFHKECIIVFAEYFDCHFSLIFSHGFGFNEILYLAKRTENIITCCVTDVVYYKYVYSSFLLLYFGI